MPHLHLLRLVERFRLFSQFARACAVWATAWLVVVKARLTM
jgi:hypothetical protein